MHLFFAHKYMYVFRMLNKIGKTKKRHFWCGIHCENKLINRSYYKNHIPVKRGSCVIGWRAIVAIEMSPSARRRGHTAANLDGALWRSRVAHVFWQGREKGAPRVSMAWTSLTQWLRLLWTDTSDFTGSVYFTEDKLFEKYIFYSYHLVNENFIFVTVNDSRLNIFVDEKILFRLFIF